MECKVCLKIDVFNVAVLIRMLPEWNVKYRWEFKIIDKDYIRMLPEWNVKLHGQIPLQVYPLH